MSPRNAVMASVAGLAVAGWMCSPAHAQSLPRYPTPEEQVQTATLNADQAAEPGTTTTIIVTPPDPATTANYNAALAAQSAAQSALQRQYDAQLKDYRDKKNAYESQKQNYQGRVDAYQSQADAYRDRVETYTDHAAAYAADLRDFDEAAAQPADALTYPDDFGGYCISTS